MPGQLFGTVEVAQSGCPRLLRQLLLRDLEQISSETNLMMSTSLSAATSISACSVFLQVFWIA